MHRRSFIGTAISLVVGWIMGRRTAMGATARGLEASSWSVRPVGPGDEDQILALMKSCVRSSDSFHGLCNELEWTRAWAEDVVKEHPRSVVIAENGVIVGYCDVPDREPRTFGVQRVDHFQRAFWCGAAGVRLDLLGQDRALFVFQQLLWPSLML